MAGGCLGYPVILMSVREPGSPAGQPGEAALELASETGEIVSPEPVDRDEHDEGGALCRRGRLRGRQSCADRQGG